MPNAIFYDPHPGGIEGCSMHLPEPVKIVADWLDGKVMEPSEAAELIREAAQTSDCRVKLSGDYIGLGIEKVHIVSGIQLYRYNWRVIRYIEEQP